MENCVITIAREYGSGGRTIGERLAQKLSIPYYDKNRTAAFMRRFLEEWMSIQVQSRLFSEKRAFIKASFFRLRVRSLHLMKIFLTIRQKSSESLRQKNPV